MTEEENRSAANLLPLCTEHALEIDTTAEHFSAELLREWKQAQLAECREIQKAWPLSNEEAVEVVEQSFNMRDFGMATAGATSVLSAARAVGHLVETARQQRHGPLHVAQAWQALRAQVNRSMPVYDAETGDRLTVEPSHVETIPYREGLETALRKAVAVLQPLAAVVVAEHHAVRATDERLSAWCEWVESVTADVVEASGRWPGRPPAEDDEALEEASAQLLRASAALSATWRGEQAEQPPPPPAPTEPEETERNRLAREHRELVDTARPWGRVKKRPYDAVTYNHLIEAMQYALDLPGVISCLSYDLRAVTKLAASVTRNADESCYRERIDEAAQMQPLAVAVNLLRELMFVAQETDRLELGTLATGHVARLLNAERWQTVHVWKANEYHARTLLGWTASISSDEAVRQTVVTALESNSELLPSILRGVAQWVETHDSRDGSFLGINDRIDDIPPWLPLQNVVAQIGRQFPNLAQVRDFDSNSVAGDVRRLASHLLRLAGNVGDQ